jgi:sporulation protein YlmC with PRC-barrel domain
MPIVSMERVREMELLDAAGVRLGSVKDLLLDPQAGRVRYAVIAVGHTGIVGALGIGERLVAVPYSVLTLESGRLVLQRNAAVIAGAPSFPPSQPPDFDRTYEVQLSTYWRVPAYWEAEAADVTSLTAADLVDPTMPSVAAIAQLPEIAAALVIRRADAARVIDEHGQLLGIVTLGAVGAAVGRHGAVAPDSSNQTPSNGHPPTPEPTGATTGVATGDGVPAHAASGGAATTLAPDDPGMSGTAMGTPVHASTGTRPNAAPIGEAPTTPTNAARSASGRQARTAACPRCGAVNRVAAGYCSGCGAQLR